jgi:small subunit ribosomal protein S18b
MTWFLWTTFDMDSRLFFFQWLRTAEGRQVYGFDFACICTGASPSPLQAEFHGQDLSDHMLSVRDTKSVEELAINVKDSRRILVVGNGGIATEFV